jgi:hypothetical protein
MKGARDARGPVTGIISSSRGPANLFSLPSHGVHLSPPGGWRGQACAAGELSGTRGPGRRAMLTLSLSKGGVRLLPSYRWRVRNARARGTKRNRAMM